VRAAGKRAHVDGTGRDAREADRRRAVLTWTGNPGRVRPVPRLDCVARLELRKEYLPFQMTKKKKYLPYKYKVTRSL
jgi:hypothetical protein